LSSSSKADAPVETKVDVAIEAVAHLKVKSTGPTRPPTPRQKPLFPPQIQIALQQVPCIQSVGGMTQHVANHLAGPAKYLYLSPMATSAENVMREA
jgi:hypothetical protein